MRKIILITIVLLFLINPIVFGYSNSLFEFKLPDNYTNSKIENKYVFIDSNNPKRGVVIDVQDVDKLVNGIPVYSKVIEANEKTKLGNEDALKFLLESENGYMEMYFIANDKYSFEIGFLGESASDFDNDDYKMIKNSFELKDKMNASNIFYIFIDIIIIGITIFIIIKIRNKNIYNKTQNKESINNTNSEELNSINDENQ